MKEPEIIINGKPLSLGEAMTVRVAIERFASDLTSDGLGIDDHGKTMTEQYLLRINDIRCLMFEG